MRTRIYLPGGILLLVAVLLLIGLVPGLTLAAGPPKGDPLADSLCATCHGDQAKAFLNNPTTAGWRPRGGAWTRSARRATAKAGSMPRPKATSRSSTG